MYTCLKLIMNLFKKKKIYSKIFKLKIYIYKQKIKNKIRSVLRKNYIKL